MALFQILAADMTKKRKVALRIFMSILPFLTFYIVTCTISVEAKPPRFSRILEKIRSVRCKKFFFMRSSPCKSTSSIFQLANTSSNTPNPNDVSVLVKLKRRFSSFVDVQKKQSSESFVQSIKNDLHYVNRTLQSLKDDMHNLSNIFPGPEFILGNQFQESRYFSDSFQFNSTLNKSEGRCINLERPMSNPALKLESLQVFASIGDVRCQTESLSTSFAEILFPMAMTATYLLHQCLSDYDPLHKVTPNRMNMLFHHNNVLHNSLAVAATKVSKDSKTQVEIQETVAIQTALDMVGNEFKDDHSQTLIDSHLEIQREMDLIKSEHEVKLQTSIDTALNELREGYEKLLMETAAASQRTIALIESKHEREVKEWTDKLEASKLEQRQLLLLYDSSKKDLQKLKLLIESQKNASMLVEPYQERRFGFSDIVFQVKTYASRIINSISNNMPKLSSRFFEQNCEMHLICFWSNIITLLKHPANFVSTRIATIVPILSEHYNAACPFLLRNVLEAHNSMDWIQVPKHLLEDSCRQPERTVKVLLAAAILLLIMLSSPVCRAIVVLFGWLRSVFCFILGIKSDVKPKHTSSSAHDDVDSTADHRYSLQTKQSRFETVSGIDVVFQTLPPISYLKPDRCPSDDSTSQEGLAQRLPDFHGSGSYDTSATMSSEISDLAALLVREKRKSALVAKLRECHSLRVSELTSKIRKLEAEKKCLRQELFSKTADLYRIKSIAEKSEKDFALESAKLREELIASEYSVTELRIQYERQFEQNTQKLKFDWERALEAKLSNLRSQLEMEHREDKVRMKSSFRESLRKVSLARTCAARKVRRLEVALADNKRMLSSKIERLENDIAGYERATRALKMYVAMNRDKAKDEMQQLEHWLGSTSEDQLLEKNRLIGRLMGELETLFVEKQVTEVKLAHLEEELESRNPAEDCDVKMINIIECSSIESSQNRSACSTYSEDSRFEDCKEVNE